MPYYWEESATRMNINQNNAAAAKAKAEEDFYKSGAWAKQQMGGGGSSASSSSQWSPYSGYGSGKEYDDAASQRRLSEAESAASIRKGETQFNYDAGDKSYANRSDTDVTSYGRKSDIDVGSFTQKQGVMEAIAQRQKATNTSQAGSMWKARDS